MALGALLEASGAEKNALDRLLGAPREISRQVLRHEGDRPEVKERWGEHLWLAMAPGERHYQRISIKNNDAL